MATTTLGVQTASTSGGVSVVSGSFTPALNDLLVVFVTATSVTVTPTMTDSQSLGFDLVTAVQVYNATDEIAVFVARKLAAASSMTVTYDCTGGGSNGTVITAYRISGADNISRYRQVKTASGAAASTPTCVLGLAANTKNVLLGVAANEANPAALTPPTSWTEDGDTGYATPTAGCETAHRDSGETLTTIAWGGTSGTAWGAAVIEVNNLSVPRRASKFGLQSVNRGSSY